LAFRKASSTVSFILVPHDILLAQSCCPPPFDSFTAAHTPPLPCHLSLDQRPPVLCHDTWPPPPRHRARAMGPRTRHPLHHRDAGVPAMEFIHCHSPLGVGSQNWQTAEAYRSDRSGRPVRPVWSCVIRIRVDL